MVLGCACMCSAPIELPPGPCAWRACELTSWAAQHPPGLRVNGPRFCGPPPCLAQQTSERASARPSRLALLLGSNQMPSEHCRRRRSSRRPAAAGVLARTGARAQSILYIDKKARNGKNKPKPVNRDSNPKILLQNLMASSQIQTIDSQRQRLID